MLSQEEIARYNRHLLLPEFGLAGQEKLKNASVLVIGAGGLGCPVLLYLAASGVGRIGIVDDDDVEESNLQRQILFNSNDIGKSKAQLAKEKLQAQNPLIQIEAFTERLKPSNAERLLNEYDIIIDGTDNFETRYLTNDICSVLKKILVSGSIFKFEGQLCVFNFKKENSPGYRCLFPSQPSSELASDCSETGVLGVLPGIIGALMALETIKVIAGIGEIEPGRMLIFNAKNLSFQSMEFEFNPDSLLSTPSTLEEFEKGDYIHVCKSSAELQVSAEISRQELLSMMEAGEKFQFLDVRETYEEPKITELEDLQIPLWKLEENLHKIAQDRKVVLICKSGTRSRKAVELLQQRFNLKNVYTLRGGVTEWLNENSDK